jgi:hypothetical protein
VTFTKYWGGWAVLATLFLALSADDARADSMRCGKRIVATGDSKHTVRAACGEPSDQQQRVETRPRRKRVPAPCGNATAPARCHRVDDGTTDVLIDEWTYDFGPRRSIQYLTFINGRLASVEAGERGRAR